MDRKLAVILFLLLISATALTLAAYFFGIFPFDLKVAVALSGEENPAVAALMTTVSFLGDGWVPVILVFAVTSICAWKKRWVEGAFVVATLSSGIIAGVLKMFVSRPRPPSFMLSPEDIFQFFNQFAYPSGHVLFFVTFFGFCSYLAWKFLAGWLRGITLSICAALILLIGPSRIYLGEHWASDVIGSYIIGTFWLIILILLYQLVLYRTLIKEGKACPI
ncbi:MAG TPA: phosphatase PAP2 family protein [Methanoregulaceae archaeon]|nr:phosphatase PAP2 family protein [Methanoregulaceae archaeon]